MINYYLNNNNNSIMYNIIINSNQINNKIICRLTNINRNKYNPNNNPNNNINNNNNNIYQISINK